VPKRMRVGPTLLIVSSGTGAPARDASSKKMSCSIGERSWPPYSFGQPMPSHPSAPIRRASSRLSGPPISWRAISSSISGVIIAVKYSRSSRRSDSCSDVSASCMGGGYLDDRSELGAGSSRMAGFEELLDPVRDRVGVGGVTRASAGPGPAPRVGALHDARHLPPAEGLVVRQVREVEARPRRVP